MFRVRGPLSFDEQRNKSPPKLTIFTPFKTVAAFYPDVINDKTRNIFPKELYCDLLDINKKTNFKINLKQSNFKDLNSILMKKLEVWDKEHLNNQKQDPQFLYTRLFKRYSLKKNDKELKKLNLINDMIKGKSTFTKLLEKEKASNKILDDFFEKKSKEQGSILKYNIAKTNTKFNVSLFLTKTQKDIEQDFGVDKKTLTAMNNQEVNSDFYTKVIKNNLKYENQLYDELMTVNNIIYDKKYEKKEIVNKLNEIYNEQSTITSEYKDSVNKKNYNFEKFQDDQKIKNAKKHRKKIVQINNQKKGNKIGMKMINKINESNDFENLTRATSKKIELEIELKKKKENYFQRMKELEIEKEQKQKEIKNIDEELEFYKYVNNVLIDEHKQYYLNILKNGYDTRAEGLIWVVRNLLELQINLEYHHFPKFLTHEEIDFILRRADMNLEGKQLKIILKILKQKQKEISTKDNIKRISEASELLSKNNFENSRSEKLYKTVDYSRDILKVKAEIDQRFFKIYAKNTDMFNKVYAEKGLEEEKILDLINSLREGLFGRFRTDKKEKEIFKIFKGDNARKQIFSLLLYIRKRLDVLEYVSNKLIEDMIVKFKEKEKFSEENNFSVRVSMQNELVKKCLFGTIINV